MISPKTLLFSALLALAVFLLPGAAFAHSDHTDNVFLAGLWHPVLGLDHLLAMVAVGILSAQMGGRAIWSVPATFVVVMALGGAAGIYAINAMDLSTGIATIEHGIVASVIVLGLAIAADKRIAVWMAMAVVAFFAFFHGFAHGYEFPEGQIPWLYIAGFMCGTAGLHIAGVLIALGTEQLKNGAGLLRHLGSALMGMGVLMALEATGIF